MEKHFRDTVHSRYREQKEFTKFEDEIDLEEGEYYAIFTYMKKAPNNNGYFSFSVSHINTINIYVNGRSNWHYEKNDNNFTTVQNLNLNSYDHGGNFYQVMIRFQAGPGQFKRIESTVNVDDRALASKFWNINIEFEWF